MRSMRASLTFQSTLPREERRLKPHKRAAGNIFQSTLPREERPSIAPSGCTVLSFQSTLPREERLVATAKGRSLILISIHAPTRGATYFVYAGYLVQRFQSTLPREERRTAVCSSNTEAVHFNPRSHERSDMSEVYIRSQNKISIHAPTRGATFKPFADHEISEISIHAPTRGATRRGNRLLRGLPNFNPRSHERSDGYGLAQWTYWSNFNPRSHERSDPVSIQLNRLLQISIHAPTRGATLDGDSTTGNVEISIHAPTRGATLWPDCLLSLSYFNPRSHERSD